MCPHPLTHYRVVMVMCDTGVTIYGYIFTAFAAASILGSLVGGSGRPSRHAVLSAIQLQDVN